MEKPRDLQVSSEITQYTELGGDFEKTAEVLLLVRPDYTIYDELRKTRDFEVYADMRLAGVGMVGVVHSSSAIDAIQRLIGRVELGVIPQVVDTVIQLENGEIEKVYKLEMTVKVPSGMVEADLARPVVEVRDFDTNALEFEIYTFGEQVVIIPVTSLNESKSHLIKEDIENELRNYTSSTFAVEMITPKKAIVYLKSSVIPKIIGKKGKRIGKIEKKLGVHIDVQELEGPENWTREKYMANSSQKVEFGIKYTKKYIILDLGRQFSKKKVQILIEEKPFLTATVGLDGMIRFEKNSPLGKELSEAITRGLKIMVTI